MAPEKRRLGSWKEFLAYWEASRDVEEEALGAIKALRASNVFDWDDVYSVRGTHGRHYTVSLFLAEVLEDEYPELGEQIYKEAVDFFLEIARLTERDGLPDLFWVSTSNRLFAFLGKNPPIEGLRGQIRNFLLRMATYPVKPRCRPDLKPPIEEEWDNTAYARALLRYQMFDALGELVEGKIYEAIPVLAAAVVEQLVVGGVYEFRAKGTVMKLVRWGWLGAFVAEDTYIAQAFRGVGDDSRVLRLLLNLSSARLDEYGLCYPIERLFEDR